MSNEIKTNQLQITNGQVTVKVIVQTVGTINATPTVEIIQDDDMLADTTSDRMGIRLSGQLMALVIVAQDVIDNLNLGDDKLDRLKAQCKKANELLVELRYMDTTADTTLDRKEEFIKRLITGNYDWLIEFLDAHNLPSTDERYACDDDLEWVGKIFYEINLRDKSKG